MNNPCVEERFKTELLSFNLAGKTVRVGLSGGADSIALAELLGLSENFSLKAVHVIHGIRESGEDDAAFVREFCEQRKIPLDIVRVDVPSFSKQRNIGIEEAARELRYKAFEEFTSKGEVIATAHTAGDVVETLLFNLARGAGPRGLAGIPRERNNIVRPLLSFWRDELTEWLKEKNIAWQNDETNNDLRFTRNRIRLILIPRLQRIFGAGAIENLRREANIFSACAQFLDIEGERIANESLIAEFDGALVLDTKIATTTLWGFGEVLRFAINRLGFGLSNLGFDTVERLYRLSLSSRRGRRFPIYDNLHLEVNGDLLFIFKKIEKNRPVYISPNNEYELPNGLGILKLVDSISAESVAYDGGALVLREPKAGDRIDPEHKLRRTLARNGVPRFLRDLVPVLFSVNLPIYSPLIGGLATQPGLYKLNIVCEGPILKIAERIKRSANGKLHS